MNQKSIDLTKADCEQVTSGNKHSILSSLKGQHVLITGGTGFLGTWITELITFLNEKYDYKIRLTLLARDTKIFSAKAPHLANKSFLNLISQDIRTLIDLPADVNYVVHAASNPDSREHNLNPLVVMDGITNGTANVFEKCTRLNNLQKIVNLSSGLVYGAQPRELKSIPETYFGSLDCSQVTSIYAESKRLSETIGTAYRIQYRLPLVTVRPFTFTGPYQSLEKPWAINNFIRDAILGEPIRILGSGETERSYMYGSDAAFWILNMLANGRVGGCYNLGSPNAIALKDLAGKIAKEFSPSPQIVSRSGKESDAQVSRFIPDTSLAQKTLHAEITVDIDSAIRRTIQWNKNF
ncbi:MAG TPA: NAD-dependent epimerase/dehydratase family protein [Bacteroidia bacterium]